MATWNLRRKFRKFLPSGKDLSSSVLRFGSPLVAEHLMMYTQAVDQTTRPVGVFPSSTSMTACAAATPARCRASAV